MFTVYMATNKVNGKRYIGVTSRGLLKRKIAHFKRAQSDSACTRFHPALLKYGEDAFEWQALAEFTSKRAAYQHEYELVEVLKPEYNACRGGMMGPLEAWNRIQVICLEDGLVYKSGMDACKSYGIAGSEMPAALRGQAAPKNLHFQRYVQPISETERELLIGEMERKRAAARRRSTRKLNVVIGGKDRLGRSAAGPMRRARKVICLTDGNVFNSVGQAAAHYGVQRSALVELCLGQRGRKTVGGLRFAYEEAA